MTKIESMLVSDAPENISLWGEQLATELTHFEHELRAYRRTKLTVEIVARASTVDGSTLGTPFKAITTDISPGGIGFIHTTAVPDKFLAIDLGAAHRRARILVEVVRCRSVGDFYEVGGKFVQLLDVV